MDQGRGQSGDLVKTCPKFSSRNTVRSPYARSFRPARTAPVAPSAEQGYESLKAAQADLGHIHALLGLANADDPEGIALIATMLEEVGDEKAPLPDVEETRRRLKSGQDLASRLTVGDWPDRWLTGKRIRKSGVSRYETDISVHLKPRSAHHRLDRLRVCHLSEMFTAIADGNAEILEQNAQRRSVIDELAIVPWKGRENRARRKAMKAAIDAMPSFPRVTGPATRLHIKATLRAS